jgi:hypothetical protein
MNKPILSVLLLLFLIACNDQKAPQNTAPQKKSITADSSARDSEDYPLVSDTLKIDKQIFFVIQPDPRSDDGRNLCVLNELNDTVYVHTRQGSNGFELEDFDRDGNLDIRIRYISNPGGLSELVMFDKKHKTFKDIGDFSDFFSPEKVENTKFWYSYHRSGCADSNWDSDLFYIKNFKAIKAGNISGRGCEGETKNGIFIYRVKGKKEILVEEHLREASFYEDKWDFIEHYWKSNYKKFE